jgi:hypothetical protein
MHFHLENLDLQEKALIFYSKKIVGVFLCSGISLCGKMNAL